VSWVGASPQRTSAAKVSAAFFWPAGKAHRQYSRCAAGVAQAESQASGHHNWARTD